MHHWYKIQMVDAPKVDAFLAEVLAVCKKHGFSLSHEDGQGAFIVEPYDESGFHDQWVGAAAISDKMPEAMLGQEEL